ncbi:protein of unknown function [Cyanobium sp. NIES-981]|nr:protein of unknown function [Cyanobium sp. NIES-981]
MSSFLAEERYRQPVPEPAGQGDGALCRREDAEPGLGTHPAAAADGPGLRRGCDTRLHPRRHHHSVRRPGRGHRRGAHPVQAGSPEPGVPGLPPPDRDVRPGRSGRRSGGEQLLHPQARQCPGLVGAAATVSCPLHAHLLLLAQPGGALFFEVDPGNRSGVNESPQPSRLGRGLDHKTHKARSGADHPQTQDCRAADRPGQDRCRRLPRDRGDAADVSPLVAAVRGMQAEEARRLPQLEKE